MASGSVRCSTPRFPTSACWDRAEGPNASSPWWTDIRASTACSLRPASTSARKVRRRSRARSSRRSSRSIEDGAEARSAIAARRSTERAEMEIKNEFDVPAPIHDVWRYLLDVDKVAPCMPGAQLTETIDDRNWKGRVTMKFGPVSLAFAGTVTMQDRDDAAHRVVLHASGMEQRGKGAANATVTSTLEPAGDGTKVRMSADVTLTGAVAQLSRGLLPDVSAKLTQQFANCLRTNMAMEATTPTAPDATE